jgi:hypothetical protein
MKTHIVIDIMYTEEEGNQMFAGTLEECNDWVAKQDTYGLEVHIMTKEEMEIHNNIKL